MTSDDGLCSVSVARVRSRSILANRLAPVTALYVLFAAAGPDFGQECFRDSTAREVYARWNACQTAPDQPPIDPACASFSVDGDPDIDLADFAAFQRDFNLGIGLCGQDSATTFVCLQQASLTLRDGSLTARGTYRTTNPPSVIELIDDDTGFVIASQVVTETQGSFEFGIDNVPVISCRLRAAMDEDCSVRDVAGAPSFCVEPSGGNLPPECQITMPATDVNIDLGDSVAFAGSATDPEGGPLTYEWDFGGGADVRPLVADPEPVTFDWNNGSFLVRFIATDDQGARCVAHVSVNVGVVPSDLPPMVDQQPGPGEDGAAVGTHVVLPFNDLGMHCADLAADPLSVLPPFNVLNAQVILKGSTGTSAPQILDGTDVELRYSAASNPRDPVGFGSINSTSQNYPLGVPLRDAVVRKTDFWDIFDDSGMTLAAVLFPGLNPLPDEGLQTIDNPDHGRYMPGINNPYVANDPQLFGAFLAAKKWFTAQGIPATGVDDRGRPNSYPLMRVQAIDKSTAIVLATTDAVVPVSSEVDCRDCHAYGQVGADPNARTSGPTFVMAASPDRIDVETAAKLNALLLHDYKHGTTFVADGQPVLCASCHRSNALAGVGGPGGDPTVPNMSAVAHGFHGRLQLTDTGELLRDKTGEPILVDPLAPPPSDWLLVPDDPSVPMESNCFRCHPGKITQCFRGAMFTAGQTCITCHGGMMAVGAVYLKSNGQPREPWLDEPKCGSCHTGIGEEPVGTLAYASGDPAAEPVPPVTDRFAEASDTLYRESHDTHAGVACEACHGSPHAIWPHRDPDSNDNVPAVQLQGYVGPIRECTVCHDTGSFPNGTLDGPHGMHPVNDPQWIHGSSGSWHRHYAEDHSQGDRCAPCHGSDHRGTRLARVRTNRVLRNTEGQVLTTLAAGEIVSCDLCHSLEESFGD